MGLCKGGIARLSEINLLPGKADSNKYALYACR